MSLKQVENWFEKALHLVYILGFSSQSANVKKSEFILNLKFSSCHTFHHYYDQFLKIEHYRQQVSLSSGLPLYYHLDVCGFTSQRTGSQRRQPSAPFLMCTSPSQSCWAEEQSWIGNWLRQKCADITFVAHQLLLILQKVFTGSPNQD